MANRLTCSTCLLLAILTGCGTAAYREKMDARLEELRQDHWRAQIADKLYGYMPADSALAGGQVNLRIPLDFDKPPFTVIDGSLATEGGQNPQVLFPAGVELPYFERTYEALGPATLTGRPRNLNLPYYLYLAAGKAEREGTDVMEELLAGFQEALPEDAPEAWQTVELTAPDGRTLTWRKLRIEGDFFFDTYTHNTQQTWEKLPGVVEVWFYSERGYHVILGTKFAEAAADVAKTERFPGVVAQTLKIEDQLAGQSGA